jgi:hypothetical protein
MDYLGRVFSNIVSRIVGIVLFFILIWLCSILFPN